MKRIFALASLAAVLGVTALAQTSAFSKGACCGVCCGDNCGQGCCQGSCPDPCCQGK